MGCSKEERKGTKLAKPLYRKFTCDKCNGETWHRWTRGDYWQCEGCQEQVYIPREVSYERAD